MVQENQERLGYEKQALNNEPMPENLSLPDQFMYQMLCQLYSEHRRGEISTERAKTEVAKIRRQRDMAQKSFEDYKKQAFRFAKLMIAVERAASAYQKDRTLENADQLIEELYFFRTYNAEDETDGKSQDN